MSATPTPRRIIIDTDPGIDDAMAIFFALASPELDVVALTTVFGNAHTTTCTENALRLLEIAERTDIPVAEGAHTPLDMKFRGPADFVHGANGQGDAPLDQPTTTKVNDTAVQLIIDLVMASPGEITLVPLGPLTNIARAVQAEPKLAVNLAGIVLMGGNAFCGGNASPAAEANIINDPDAADIVFGVECPVAMAGLDVTEQIVMTGAQLDLIGSVDTPRARHLHAILPYYRRFALESGLDGIHVHDSTAISYLLTPERFSSVRHAIRVDTGNGVGRGKTWARTKRAQHGADPWAGRPLVTILTGVDADAVVRLELTRLGVTL